MGIVDTLAPFDDGIDIITKYLECSIQWISCIALYLMLELELGFIKHVGTGLYLGS